MDLKEKIVNKIITDGGGGAAYYDGIIYDGEAGSLHEAMDEISKKVAITFGVWMLSEAILPRDSFWFDAGKHLTTDELYQLFTKSKHYQELMDAK